MPWKGKSDLMVDRFDGRALIDIIPSVPKLKLYMTDEEKELEDALNYHRFSVLIENEVNKVNEKEWIKEVAEKLEVKEVILPTEKEIQELMSAPDFKKPQAAAGEYSSVGFSYGSDEEEEEEYERPEIKSEMVAAQGPEQEELGQEEKMEKLEIYAKKYGVYSFFKHREEEEREEEMRQAEARDREEKKGQKKLSRRERRSRKRRRRSKIAMGQLWGGPAYERHRHDRRGSPTYDDYSPQSASSKKRKSKSQSKSPRRSKTPEKQFITEFQIQDVSEKGTTEDGQFAPSSPTKKKKVAKEEGENIMEAIGQEEMNLLARTSLDRRTFAQKIDQIYNRHIYKGARVQEEKMLKRGPPPNKGNAVQRLKAAKKKKKKPKVEKLTPQERLKRRMRQQLNKQIKTDKKEERIKRKQKLKERRAMLGATGPPRSGRKRRRTRSYSRSRSRSRSNSRRRSRSRSRRDRKSDRRSRSRSPRSKSRSRSRSRRSRTRSRSRSRSRRSRTRSRSRRRSRTRSRSRSRRSRSRSKSRSRRSTSSRKRRRDSSSRSRSRSRSRRKRRRRSSSSRSRSRSSSRSRSRRKRRRRSSSSRSRSRSRS